MELPKEDAESMLAVARRLGVAESDYVVMADGSGSVAKQPCGWYAAVLSVRSVRAVACLGAAGQGTNNYAELAPFCHALWFIETTRFGWQRVAREVEVSCVSDSELTVRCGSGRYVRNANLNLWASIDWFANAGYRLRWMHVPRNSNEWARAADAMANVGRMAVAGALRPT